ncbi:hypothetical protein ACHAPU_002647 [Fusarium lateritium]
MALDFGFDIFPHLAPTEENKNQYRKFLIEVARTGKVEMIDEPLSTNDSDDERTYKYFRILVPGEPRIPDPESCDCFLSVRSNDTLDPEAFGVIIDMSHIALHYFGSRVHFWRGHSLVYSSGELQRAENEARRRAEEVGSMDTGNPSIASVDTDQTLA